MRQWEIFFLHDLPHGPHPVVVISPDWVCSNATIKIVNVLLCSSIRGDDVIGEYEVGLNSAEGLENLSGCQCHSMLTVKKTRFEGLPLVGMVSSVRRSEIKRKLRSAFNLL